MQYWSFGITWFPRYLFTSPLKRHKKGYFLMPEHLHNKQLTPTIPLLTYSLVPFLHNCSLGLFLAMLSFELRVSWELYCTVLLCSCDCVKLKPKIALQWNKPCYWHNVWNDRRADLGERSTIEMLYKITVSLPWLLWDHYGCDWGIGAAWLCQKLNH